MRYLRDVQGPRGLSNAILKTPQLLATFIFRKMLAGASLALTLLFLCFGTFGAVAKIPRRWLSAIFKSAHSSSLLLSSLKARRHFWYKASPNLHLRRLLIRSIALSLSLFLLIFLLNQSGSGSSTVEAQGANCFSNLGSWVDEGISKRITRDSWDNSCLSSRPPESPYSSDPYAVAKWYTFSVNATQRVYMSATTSDSGGFAILRLLRGRGSSGSVMQKDEQECSRVHSSCTANFRVTLTPGSYTLEVAYDGGVPASNYNLRVYLDEDRYSPPVLLKGRQTGISSASMNWEKTLSITASGLQTTFDIELCSGGRRNLRCFSPSSINASVSTSGESASVSGVGFSRWSQYTGVGRFRVKAQGADDVHFSEKEYFQIQGGPGVPTGLAARVIGTDANRTIALTWNKPANGYLYAVRSSISPSLGSQSNLPSRGLGISCTIEPPWGDPYRFCNSTGATISGIGASARTFRFSVLARNWNYVSSDYSGYVEITVPVAPFRDLGGISITSMALDSAPISNGETVVPASRSSMAGDYTLNNDWQSNEFDDRVLVRRAGETYNAGVSSSVTSTSGNTKVDFGAFNVNLGLNTLYVDVGEPPQYNCLPNAGSTSTCDSDASRRVSIYRGADSSVDLSAFSASDVSISRSFSPSVRSYSGTAASSVTRTTITADSGRPQVHRHHNSGRRVLRNWRSSGQPFVRDNHGAGPCQVRKWSHFQDLHSENYKVYDKRQSWAKHFHGFKHIR